MPIYVGVDGLARKLNTAPAGQEPPHPAVGTIKTFMFNGIETDFRIVHVGPINDQAYKGWDDCVVLMPVNTLGVIQWSETWAANGDSILYWGKTSGRPDNTLNTTVLNMFDVETQELMVEGRFPWVIYKPGVRGMYTALPANTAGGITSSKLVLPSLAELGVVTETGCRADGSPLDYFRTPKKGADPNPILEATNKSGTPTQWATRTYNIIPQIGVVLQDGSVVDGELGISWGMRPLFAVPRNTYPETAE